MQGQTDSHSRNKVLSLARQAGDDDKSLFDTVYAESFPQCERGDQLYLAEHAKAMKNIRNFGEKNLHELMVKLGVFLAYEDIDVDALKKRIAAKKTCR